MEINIILVKDIQIYKLQEKSLHKQDSPIAYNNQGAESNTKQRYLLLP